MIIDLTMTLEHGQRGVEFEEKYTLERDGWNARTHHLYSHAGTHLDAPVHFGCGTTTVDQIPLERFMGRAHVARLTDIAPRALITVADLGEVAETLHPGDSLLLATGWSRHAGDPEYYRDHFPRVSEELALWCVARKVKMLGVEPPSVGDVNHLPEVTLIHQILLGAGTVIVEGLTDLDKLPQPTVHFYAIPLKVGGADGTPCRAFATLPAPA